MKKIYNLIAKGVRIIIDNTDEIFSIKYTAMSDIKSKKLNNQIKSVFDDLNYNNIDNHSKEIESFIMQCVEKNDMYLLTRLLTTFDKILGSELDSFHNLSDMIEGLNTNIEDTKIQIIPKRKSSWANKNKERNCSPSLNNLFEHMMYIDLSNYFKNFKIMHVFLNGNIMESCFENGYIQIGASPLIDVVDLNPKKNQDNESTNILIVPELKDENVKNNILKIFEKSIKDKVNILCFPEMLGSSEIVALLQKRIQALDDEAPILTICPSYMKERKNIVTVLDQDGYVLFEQEKHWPYNYKDGDTVFNEDIVHDSEINVIHCDGLGRVVILICKDALNTSYIHHVLEELKVTLMIVPSYSTGCYDFEQNLKVVESYNCNALWINTCAAQSTLENKNDIIGFVIKTGKKTFVIKNGKFDFEIQNCKKLHGGECKDCLFVQKIYCERTGL